MPTSTIAPASPDQLAAHRAAAHEASHIRVEVKRRLKAGELTLAAVLADQRPAVHRMKVRHLLAALPGVGVRTAEHLMAQEGIAPQRRISGLGPNQRANLMHRTTTARRTPHV